MGIRLNVSSLWHIIDHSNLILLLTKKFWFIYFYSIFPLFKEPSAKHFDQSHLQNEKWPQRSFFLEHINLKDLSKLYGNDKIMKMLILHWMMYVWPQRQLKVILGHFCDQNFISKVIEGHIRSALCLML